MEKTDNFSFYDLLTFIIPGFTLVLYGYTLCQAMGWELQPVASHIPENNVLTAVLALMGSFIAGFILHYINEQKIFGVDLVIKRQRRRYNNGEFFMKDLSLIEKINEKVTALYGWEIIDGAKQPTERADDIFELYYNKFFNSKKLRVFNRYQLPFFLFCNLTLVLWLIALTYGTACWFMFDNDAISSIFFVVILFLLSLLCLKVAFKHRKRFIEVMWLSIYEEMIQSPSN